jgi:hypothetical protein
MERETLKKRAERLGILKTQLIYRIYKLHLKTDKEIMEYCSKNLTSEEFSIVQIEEKGQNKQEIKFDTSKEKTDYILKDIFLKLVENEPEKYNLEFLYQKTAKVNLNRRERKKQRALA